MAGKQQELSFAVRAVNEASKTLKEVEGDVGKLGDAADKSGGHASKFGGALGSVAKIASGFVVGNALMMAPALIGGIASRAKELELQMKKATIVFGDQLPEVEKWAKANAGAMGLTSKEAVNLAAGLQDLLVPMGMSREAAAAMSTKTIGLAGALSEWTGGQRSAAEVSDILTKAYLGETDGLKGLGISISAADVSARLAEKGQKDLTGAALQQAQALAIQGLVFEKSTDAQDAFAKGSGSAARKQAEMTAKIQEFKDEAALKLIPVMTKIGEVIFTKIVPAISEFADKAAPKVTAFFDAVQEHWEKEAKPALAALQSAFETMWPVIEPILNEIANKVELSMKQIGDVLAIVSALLSGDWAGAWKAAKQLVTDTMDSMAKSVENGVALIKGLGKLAAEAGQAIGGAVVQGIKNGFTGAFGIVGDMRDAIWSGLKALINMAIDGINSALEFTITMPGSIPNLHIDPPDIPRLAAGGIVIRPTLALIGESGPEAVVPLSRGAGAGGGLGGHTFNIYAIDGESVRRIIPTLARELAQYDRRAFGTAV